uniref:Small ribosomal subunit protein mS26 n=1 Tax=Graphocephala atropunctata TaxID=36148 RepID=A0A1B6L7S0_9HEMI
MSRFVTNSFQLCVAQLKISSQTLVSRKSPCIQCIRCYRPRKPFWLPMAKSKMFRIPKKPNIPVEEDVELSRLYNVWRTNIKSIQHHFKEQLRAQTTGIEVIEERRQRALEHHANCVRENELWNAEVAKLREERQAREAAIREKEIQAALAEHEREQKILMEQIDASIRREKEAAKSYITPENIDEAIENALSNVMDHNFCIDLEGNIFKGRYGKPPPSPSDMKPSLSQPSTERQDAQAKEASN